ncbi:uncharacterized protein EDB93DRAFT_1086687 [Suillus bovinus]|uniref:uncharacterized protein n=1 Tax=Suillus bovinus TaxID=48563 RepID=UPI001B86F64D|nr:uncharacterized protein EDB93DRAFT_1086687 [Suillus bovinus]KAG2146159.1 hypothetical protein EDB93DRAFT_1086687 [Suillus bovinus]
MGPGGNQRRHGISLPKSLLEQINDSEQNSHRHKSGRSHASRKDARKQERADRKKRKADHFIHTAHSAKRKTEDEHVNSPQRKRMKTSQESDSRPPSSKSHNAAATKVLPRHRPAEPHTTTESVPKQKLQTTALEKLVNKSAAKPRKVASTHPRSREEEEEDAYIAYLESKLGYAGGGSRRKDDDMDGLGDTSKSALQLRVVSCFQSTQDSDLDDEMEDEDQSTSAKDQSDESWEDEAWGGLDELSKNDGSKAGENDDSVDDDDHEVTETEEGEPSDSQPKVTGRYIPPGLRKQSNSETEEQLKLTRQLKGLINRMSEQNIATILDSIEDVYRNHRRHDVTSTLTNLIIDGISSHSTLLDSYVVLHAAFISSLHKLIGTAFAAYFVQNVVSSYEQHLASVEERSTKSTEIPEDLGKECSNLIVLLSELYNFQVISCILVYDIIRGLLDKDLSEFRVELLLKLLRSSGQQLRQDDPMALKDIITLAQSRVTGQADTISSRTRFMIETLNNLKNNKIKKTAATQHQGGDAVERMKKFLSGLGKKKHVLAHEPLRVTLEDLHSAESKGKWWLIGAAWAGDPLADQSREVPQHGGEPETGDVSTTALLKLARKQGMNTDIRRSIFVVLMSSDDYLDACERLAQLGLTEVQQREIIRVNLHCCGNEKSYNPYYTLVCQHLSQRSHSYKITLQFCLWDFIRDLGESSVGGVEVIKSLKDNDVGFNVKSMSPSRMRNVAKAYAWWIAKDSCTLTIFKPVDFTILKPQTRTFLKELFIQLFIASQVSSPMLGNDSDDYPSMRNRGSLEEIFLKASRIENLGLGLVFFMSNTFKGEDGFLSWASSVAKETLQTGMDHIPRI